MRPLAARPLALSIAGLQEIYLALSPHGGQHRARRNAWGAMAMDSARMRGRREANAAIQAAEERATAGELVLSR
ncbi:MAG: hypothetical protein M3Z02_13445 [Actinomycetota bacterium]|nr:hypothetical protein [Actinomycetota bacterium]